MGLLFRHCYWLVVDLGLVQWIAFGDCHGDVLVDRRGEHFDNMSDFEGDYCVGLGRYLSDLGLVALLRRDFGSLAVWIGHVRTGVRRWFRAFDHRRAGDIFD